MRSVASYNPLNPLAARLVGCRFNWTTRRVENQGVRRPLTAELRSQSFETVSLRESLVRCEPLRGFRYRGSRVFGTIACLPQAVDGQMLRARVRFHHEATCRSAEVSVRYSVVPGWSGRLRDCALTGMTVTPIVVLLSWKLRSFL